MQATVPTWVSWYRRARARDAAHGEARARPRARNTIAVYTFGREPHTHAELIRLSSMLGSKRGLDPAAEPWLPADYQTLAHWRVPSVLYNDITQRHEFESISLAAPATAPPTEPLAGAHHGWGAAARGWAAGTLLLALLVLLVRTAEKCMDRRLFHRHSRRAAELPRTDPEACPYPETRNPDLPPPYSECAELSADTIAGPIVVDSSKLDVADEPPPPYSACSVAFSNPKDGVPAVHIRNRRQRDEPCSSQNIPSDEEGTEMVFENGRVVVRQELGVEDVANGGTETSSNTTTYDDQLHTGVSPSDVTRERVFRV